MRHVGDLTTKDLLTSGHVREAAPARGDTGALTYMQELASIRHYIARDGVPVTHLVDRVEEFVTAVSTAHWEAESP